MLNFTELGIMKVRLRLKVLTFNIHNGINWGEKYDLEQIAAFIGEIKPDLAGIQEVSRFWSPKTNFQDMVSLLGERLGRFPVFAASLNKGHKASFGNLILSKYPILNTWTEILPGKLEPRSYLAVQVLADGARVNFLTTHLGLSDTERLNQITKLVKFCAKMDGPLIITGDFNENPNGQGIAILKENWIKHTPSPPQGTLRLSDQELGSEIDMIFTSSDWALKSLIVFQNKLSDHLPVVAELELVLPWTQVAGQPVRMF